jgi:two-component system LytT family response regulator/two-component system response regulator LytT
MPIRTLIVDDEDPTRDELCFLLEGLSGVEIVGQAANGPEALKAAEELSPDLVLLDVQMPGLTGFEVARRLVASSPPPHVVFVTAFDRYAIEAFNVNAVDYLLKPVEATRLAQAVDRVRHRIATERPARAPVDAATLEHLAELVTRRFTYLQQLALKVGERFLLVQVEDVIHASLVDDAITVVTIGLIGTSNYRTLDELQARLDPAVFWRVHRSHLVNINKIKEIVPWFSRNYILKMKDAKATEIPVSRSQTKRLREYLRM